MSEPRILLACFPKSGSTFVSRALANYLGVAEHTIHLSPEVQELVEDKLKIVGNSGFVAQSHVIPTRCNIALIEKYNLQTVILERSVTDCLVSLRDMYVERIGSRQGIWVHEFVSLFGYYGRRFLAMTQSEQYDYLIESILQWYLGFYVAWRNPDVVGSIPRTFVRYETFFSTVENEFELLLKDLEIYEPDKLASFQFPGKEEGARGVRFNVGRVGRGAELLSQKQQQRILEIARIFERANNCDLSGIL